MAVLNFSKTGSVLRGPAGTNDSVALTTIMAPLFAQAEEYRVLGQQQQVSQNQEVNTTTKHQASYKA